jgi:hypothetical protein
VPLVAVDQHRAERAVFHSGDQDLERLAFEAAPQDAEQLVMLAGGVAGLGRAERVLFDEQALLRRRELPIDRRRGGGLGMRQSQPILTVPMWR